MIVFTITAQTVSEHITGETVIRTRLTKLHLSIGVETCRTLRVAKGCIVCDGKEVIVFATCTDLNRIARSTTLWTFYT